VHLLVLRLLIRDVNVTQGIATLFNVWVCVGLLKQLRTPLGENSYSLRFLNKGIGILFIIQQSFINSFFLNYVIPCVSVTNHLFCKIVRLCAFPHYFMRLYLLKIVGNFYKGNACKDVFVKTC